MNKGWGQATGYSCVFPSVLWQWWLSRLKVIQSVKNLSSTNPRGFLLEQLSEAVFIEWKTQVQLEKWPLNSNNSFFNVIIVYSSTFVTTSLSTFMISNPVSQHATLAATLSRPLAIRLSREKHRRGNTRSVCWSRSVGQKSFPPSPTYATRSYLTSEFWQCSSRMWPLHMLTELIVHQSCCWYGDKCRQPELSNDAGFVYTLLNTDCRPAVSRIWAIIACQITSHGTISMRF